MSNRERVVSDFCDGEAVFDARLESWDARMLLRDQARPQPMPSLQPQRAQALPWPELLLRMPLSGEEEEEMRKTIFFCWGAVYWPFLLVGFVFMVLFELFSGIGGYLHDVLVDWAYPPAWERPAACGCHVWPDSHCMRHQTGEGKTS